MMLPAYSTMSNFTSVLRALLAVPDKGITSTHSRGQVLQMPGEGEIPTCKLESNRSTVTAAFYKYRERIS